MRYKKIGLLALLASFAAGEIMAAPFAYNSGDVLLCFRNGGANDLVVDAGPVATFTGASPNQRINISQYSVAQLNAAVGINGVNWSAFSWSADNTLFVTAARSSLNTQSSPWQAKSASNQGHTAQRMATIPLGAVDNAGYNGLNTASAVIEGDVSAGNATYLNGVSYHDALFGATGGNFGGNFVGNPEIATSGNFTTSGTAVRADFYRMTPTSGAAYGTLLGYFEFATNGTMSYVAYPTAVPVISSISRSNTTSTINYVTGTYGTYTLRGTNSLNSGVSPGSWPAITTLSTGDVSVHTATDTDASPNKFYIITAQ